MVLTMVAADFVAAIFCALLAIAIRSELLPGLSNLDPFAPVRNYISLWPALVLLLAGRAAVGLYPGFGIHPAEELRRQTWVTAGLAVLVLAGSALFQFSQIYSRVVLVGTAALLLVFLPSLRAMVKGTLARSSAYGLPVWIFGASARSTTIAEILKANPQLGLRPIGSGSDVPDHVHHVSHCVVVPDGLDVPLAAMLDDVSVRFKRVWLVPRLLDIASVWVVPRDFHGHLALELRNTLLERRSRATKRVLDLLLASLLLPFAAAASLFIAVAIRIDSPGPILYRQERVGKDGRRFHIVKFRSMILDAGDVLERHLAESPVARNEWNLTRKLARDPRVTSVGRVLRRSSLDELPQLLNVLRGQMSFVGPRPTMPDEVSWYGEGSHLLMKVMPGLTGLTQVSGRSTLSYQERVRADTFYVRNWSVWLDLVILGRTLGTVIRGTGAY